MPDSFSRHSHLSFYEAHAHLTLKLSVVFSIFVTLVTKMFDDCEYVVDINGALDRKCLFELFRWLPFKERVKCESVCKAWKELIEEVNATKQTALSFLGEAVNSNIVQNFCTNPVHRLWKTSDVIDRSHWMPDILLVLKKVPGLKALHLRADDFAPILRDGEAEEIGKLLPKLEHFSLIDDMIGTTIFNDSLKLIKSMPNLFHLEMRFPAREGSGKTEMVQENLLITEALDIFKGNLEILSTNIPLNRFVIHFHEMPFFLHTLFFPLSANCKTLSSSCNKIRKLSLVGTALPVPGLNSFLNEGGVRGKYLRCLSIAVDSEEQLQMICHNMICLQSFHCVVNVKNLKNVGAIGQLKNLKNLFLSSWSNELLDEGLLKVFIGCRQLSSLIINGEVSDSSFKLLSDFCFFAKRIEINNGKRGDKITDASVYAFCKLEFLYSLTLYYCEVSDDAVKCLFENCKDLAYLRLTCNSKLTKDIFPHCIEFAKEKPMEKVTFVLPDRLQRYWRDFDVPRNLVMQFL